MARYDKYDPISGGFRAHLEEDWDAAAVGVPTGVGLNASGRIVAGSGNTGVVGVLVIDAPKFAGDVVDTMTAGEIVDCEDLSAGTEYFSSAAGVLGTTNTDTKVGHTVEAERLVVRCTGQAGA